MVLSVCVFKNNWIITQQSTVRPDWSPAACFNRPDCNTKPRSENRSAKLKSHLGNEWMYGSNSQKHPKTQTDSQRGSTRGWRRQHSEAILTDYSSSSVVDQNHSLTPPSHFCKLVSHYTDSLPDDSGRESTIQKKLYCIIWQSLKGQKTTQKQKIVWSSWTNVWNLHW